MDLSILVLVHLAMKCILQVIARLKVRVFLTTGECSIKEFCHSVRSIRVFQQSSVYQSINYLNTCDSAGIQVFGYGGHTVLHYYH